MFFWLVGWLIGRLVGCLVWVGVLFVCFCGFILFYFFIFWLISELQREGLYNQGLTWIGNFFEFIIC